MSGKQRVVYWDACIILAYIKNEQRLDQDEMRAIKEMVNAFELGALKIVTSTVSIVEVLESSTGLDPYAEFIRFRGRPNLSIVGVTTPIAETAHAIRDFYYKENSPTVYTPDAIHLATAINHKCQSFYTFDGSRKNRPGLLDLSPPFQQQFGIPVENPVSYLDGQLSLGWAEE